MQPLDKGDNRIQSTTNGKIHKHACKWWQIKYHATIIKTIRNADGSEVSKEEMNNICKKQIRITR